MMATLTERIAMIKSDLKDCTNPEILRKYPHLGDPVLIEQLTNKLHKLQQEALTGIEPCA